MPRKEAQPKPPQVAPQPRKWKRGIAFAASGLAVVGLCIALKSTVGNKPANAQIPNPFRKNQPAEQSTTQPAAKQGAQQASASLPQVERPQHDVMAVVNGQDIRRDALATACCERYGTKCSKA